MKQKTLILIAASIILFSLVIDYSGILNPLSYKNEDLAKSLLLNASLLSLITILLAILTLGFSVRYDPWWQFAKYAIPVCFTLIVAINLGLLHTTTYGTFGWGDMLNQTYDFIGLGVVYGVFIIGSLIQIVRGYRTDTT
jgi:hypothetical protein